MDLQQQEMPGAGDRGWFAASLVALCCAIAFFLFRTVPNIAVSGDLSMIWACTRVWLDGGNPYAFDEIIAVFRGAGGDPLAVHTRATFTSLYPPSTYLLFAPFGLLSWDVVRPVFFLVNGVLLGLITWGLSDLLRSVHSPQPRAVAVMLGSLFLVWGPTVTTVRMGQISLFVLAMIIAAVIALRNGRSVLSGVLLGVATAMKPQLAGLYVLLLAIAGEWRAFTVAVGAGLSLLIAAIMPLQLNGHAWITTLRENLTLLSYSPDSSGNPTIANNAWHNVLDLRTLFHVWLDDRRLVAGLAIGFGVTGVAIAVELGRRIRWSARHPEGADWLLLPSILAPLTVLPIYHRFYDLILLVFPILWVWCRVLERRVTWSVLLVVMCLAIYLLPNSTMMVVQWINPRMPPAVTGSAAWRSIVTLHQIWVLVLLWMVLLSAAWPSEQDSIRAEAERAA